MSPLTIEIIRLRRGLALFVGLLSVTVTCGLIWGGLASVGDTTGARAFRWFTLIGAVGSCASGIALFIVGVWYQIQRLEQSGADSTPPQT